jgi:hypothetical protein
VLVVFRARPKKLATGDTTATFSAVAAPARLTVWGVFQAVSVTVSVPVTAAPKGGI